MVKAFVGAGGKTTLLLRQAEAYRAQGKRVFVTTTTHMYLREDTIPGDDPEPILRQLRETGYAMAGIPEGEKIRSLSPETYQRVCEIADIVLVEADGAARKPLKMPNATEPVIPPNTDEIVIVCGLHGLGKPAKEVCHRLELVRERLGIRDDTPIAPEHIAAMVRLGYVEPLRRQYLQCKLLVSPACTPGQEEIAAWIQKEALK